MHNALNTILKVMTVLISLLSFTLARNESNTTRTVAVKATLSTHELQGLILTSTVNVGETIQLSVMGTYSDGSSKTVDENITYTVTPVENAEVNGSVLTAQKDGNVTVQATVGGVKSNSITLSISGRTNNYVLPPEPDPAVNNATLAGVDSNNNGVRDDVERKIYEKYPVKLQRALLIDGAKVFQEIAVKPVEEAKEIVKDVTRVLNCKTYLRRKDEKIRSYKFELVKSLENLTYNNKERVQKYLDYNLVLSGGSYGGDYADINEKACSPEVIKALEEKGL